MEAADFKTPKDVLEEEKEQTTYPEEDKSSSLEYLLALGFPKD